MAPAHGHHQRLAVLSHWIAIPPKISGKPCVTLLSSNSQHGLLFAAEPFRYRLQPPIIMKRSASAIWQGSLKTGKGTLTAPGGALRHTEYSFGSRFESGAGTNPEELIAAAHAGCFAMALSAMLGEAGLTPERLDVTADVSLDNVPPAGWTVTASHLTLKATIPGIDQAKFDDLTAKAKAGCPISRLLNAKITLDAHLV